MMDLFLPTAAAAVLFWFPLLLTLKLVTSKPTRPDHAVFLLNYWICYAAVSNIQMITALDSPYLFYVFALIKTWLFYGHGCLLVNYCFVELVFNRIFIRRPSRSQSTFQVIELNLIDPLAKQLALNVVVVNLCAVLRQSRLAVGVAIANFHLAIARSHESFLQASLDYWCFIDSQLALDKMLRRYVSVVTSLTSMVALPRVHIDIETRKPTRRPVPPSPSPTPSPPSYTEEQLMKDQESLNRHYEHMIHTIQRDQMHRERALDLEKRRLDDARRVVSEPSRKPDSRNGSDARSDAARDRVRRFLGDSDSDRAQFLNTHRGALQREILKGRRSRDPSPANRADPAQPPPLWLQPTSDLPVPGFEVHYSGTRVSPRQASGP